MTDAPAPDAGGAPAAPAAEPAAPVAPAPTAPVQPGGDQAPATPPAEPELTADEQAAKAEDDEWGEAEKKLFPGLKSTKKKGDKDEQAKPGEGDEEESADGKTPKDKSPDAKPGEDDDAKKTGTEEQPAGDGEEEAGAPDTSARDARAVARENQQQLETIKTDVRKQMFSEVPTQLQDTDGDPISTIEDVMRLINPQTGEQFKTEEEAGMWLLAAQQQFNKNLESINQQVDQIAETNIDLKDQSDAITYEYGELLKHPDMKELRDQLWAEYSKTLVKDEKTGIIMKAPVSLETFYRTALEPYANLARELESREQKSEADTQAQAAADAKAKEDAEKDRQQKRADRSDIYGGGTNKNEDPADKEWGEAEEAVFGKQLRK